MNVTIIGGGLVGLGIAWRCASRGAAVTIVDPAPTTGASWVAAGMLAPVIEAHYGEEPLLQLNLESAARYEAFSQELRELTGVDPGYVPCGTVAVARDGDENAELGELFDFQQSLGLSVSRLSSKDVRDIEPALAPSVRGGLLVEGDHQVDNRRLVSALRSGCEQLGVEFVYERATHAQRRQVTIETGTIMEAGEVVVCAGAYSGTLELRPEPAPVRPVKGQILRLRAAPNAINPSRVIRGLGVYVAPRPSGEVVVGASVEDRGFDTTVTAGPVYELLRDAWELVPAIQEMELVETSAGLRPGSPDNAPLIGRLHDDGPIIAAGHHRNGVLLTPVTADTVADLVLTGRVDPAHRTVLPAPFRRVRGLVTMNITLNGEPRAVADTVTVAELTSMVLGDRLSTRGVAVAVNFEAIPRSLWPATLLTEGDCVEILTAMQGG